jgi:hypothetical protein
MRRTLLPSGLAVISFCAVCFGQQDAPADTNNKRIFGIIPNARSSPSLVSYEPLTVKQKFKIAKDDCFDRGTFALAAVFGGVSDLQRSNPSFGGGVQGYAKYFGTAYGDFLIGNMMTEGIYPSLLHQDPRYFRLGSGSKKARLGHSIKQIFYTRADSGAGQVNYSELLGNATAVAISNSYYPENRNAHDAVTKWGSQIGIDLAANVLKEFGPDLMRLMSRKH